MPLPGATRTNLTLHMRLEYYRWLCGLADRLGLPLNATYDTALVELAARAGYPLPPPRLPRRRSAPRNG